MNYIDRGPKQPMLVVARHAETEFNAAGKWSGRLETPLTANGRKQAETIARHVSDIGIDIVFTSTSERTKATWAVMQGVLGLSDVPVVHSEGLLERDIGRFAGLTYDQIIKQFNLSVDELERIRLGHRERSPDGETREEVYHRVSRTYENDILPAISKGRKVCVVGHNISTSALMTKVEALPDTEMGRLEIERAKALCYAFQLDLGDARPVQKFVRPN